MGDIKQTNRIPRCVCKHAFTSVKICSTIIVHTLYRFILIMANEVSHPEGHADVAFWKTLEGHTGLIFMDICKVTLDFPANFAAI